MNGRVMPLDGAICTLTIMLISACRPNWMTRPAAARMAKLSSSSSRLISTRATIAEVEHRDGEAGDEPELLADDREDVIGVRLGQPELARAAARPHAEQAARGERAHRILGLEGVALLEQEAVDPLRRDRVEKVGEHHDRDARRPPRMIRHAASTRRQARASRPTPQTKMIVLPKLGCFISSKRSPPVSDRRERIDRQRLVPVLEAQQPRHGDDEERLQEFGRLDLREAELDPAPGAVHSRGRRSARGSAARRRTPRRTATAAARVRAASSRCRSSPECRPRSTSAGARNNKASREVHVAARVALRRRRARPRRPRSARSRSAPRPAAAGPCRSPRTSGRSRSCPSGRNGRVHQRRLGFDLAGNARDHRAPTRLAECVPAVFEVAELVEARAGRRQQHGVPRLRLRRRFAHRPLQRHRTLPPSCAATSS